MGKRIRGGFAKVLCLVLFAALAMPMPALAATETAMPAASGIESEAGDGVQSAQSVKDGFVTENGQQHYYKNGTLVASSKVKANGKTYYLDSDGAVAKGKAVKIDGKYYIIGNNGKLLTPSKSKIYKLASGYYYVNKKGNPAKTSWFTKSGKLYYASKAGKLKASGSKQGITFTSKGYAKNNLASKLKKKVMTLIAKNTDSSWSKKKKFETMVKWTRKHGKWSMVCAVNDVNNPAWVQRQAWKAFNGKYTMCIAAACQMALFAYELGYTPTLFAIPNYHGCVYVDGKRYDWNNPQLSMKGAYKFKVTSWAGTTPKTAEGTERSAAAAISKKVSADYSGSVKHKGSYYVFKNGSISTGSAKHTVTIGDTVYGVSASGKALTGVHVVKGKLFAFKSNGAKDAAKTSKLRKLGKEGMDAEAFIEAAGKPSKRKYISGSCYGNGDDGIITYKNFYLYTFRSSVTGKEQVLSFISR